MKGVAPAELGHEDAAAEEEECADERKADGLRSCACGKRCSYGWAGMTALSDVALDEPDDAPGEPAWLSAQCTRRSCGSLPATAAAATAASIVAGSRLVRANRRAHQLRHHEKPVRRRRRVMRRLRRWWMARCRARKRRAAR